MRQEVKLLALLDGLFEELLAARAGTERGTDLEHFAAIADLARRATDCAGQLELQETASHSSQLAHLATGLLEETERAAQGGPRTITARAGFEDLEERTEVLQMTAEREIEKMLTAGKGSTCPAQPSVETKPHSPSMAPGADSDQNADLLGGAMPVAEFVGETREHLGVSEQELLALEQDPANIERVHTIFRSFHTIKGLTAIAGLEKARQVAHQCEALLDLVRGGSGL